MTTPRRNVLGFLPLPLLLAVVLVLAGCGGGGVRAVPTDAVAVVGPDTITKAQFNQLLDSAKSAYKAKKTAFPKVGTAAYRSLSDSAVTFLVQQSELTQKGKEIGVTVTPKDIAQKIAQLEKQYKWTEKQYQAALKQSGLTQSQFEQDVYAQLLSERLYAKVTADVKVTGADAEKYYRTHLSTYTTPASRSVRHILVNSKSLAQQLETQLRRGASFAALAQKYSKDTGSAKDGGKLTISKGETVKPFEDAAFSLKTKEISAPVRSVYGWHIIQALGPVIPAKTTPFASLETSIRETLLSQRKSQAMQGWVDQLKKQFASQVAYQTGYAPAATPAPATSTTP